MTSDYIGYVITVTAVVN